MLAPHKAFDLDADRESRQARARHPRRADRLGHRRASVTAIEPGQPRARPGDDGRPPPGGRPDPAPPDRVADRRRAPGGLRRALHRARGHPARGPGGGRPAALGRPVAGPRRVRAARAEYKRLRDDVDITLLHDPELLLAVAGGHGKRPVVWDVHEDTAAALGLKAWMPRPLRRPFAAAVHAAEAGAERSVHLLLAEHGYVDRFRRLHPVVPNQTDGAGRGAAAGRGPGGVPGRDHAGPRRGRDGRGRPAAGPGGRAGRADRQRGCRVDAAAGGRGRRRAAATGPASSPTTSPWPGCPARWPGSPCCTTSRTTGTRCRPRSSSTWPAACRW